MQASLLGWPTRASTRDVPLPFRRFELVVHEVSRHKCFEGVVDKAYLVALRVVVAKTNLAREGEEGRIK